ncbi:hypothetical protein BOTBODRAFT_144237 [Botryobasidium botryosum FD-172 SS1]|uniref:Inosine/uridine-preferring nucleoside hydrolase domain-containing protein n=1 Tax=Botryobasidium botryosum (strain FD-172 SS1) TaxID=930990 RepID=A0A067MZV2_BOTB1|nr:hypothetical protein BOTBODRAFT_144237 [Botryobasidium botryosum FD-172 SS1]
MARKVILDTDPGVDDALALFLLLASPEIELAAITTIFGNTTIDHVYTNVLKIYQIVQRYLDANPEDMPRFPNLSREPRTILARGAARPLAGELGLAEYYHGPDGLSNISQTHPEFDLSQNSGENHPPLTISSKPAHEVILDALDQAPPKTIDILAVGPLTNVALALGKSPTTLGRARRIICMGGAFESPGNTTASAEFNFFADPYAAHEVLKAASQNVISLFQIPLDLTRRYVVPFAEMIPPEPDKNSLIQYFLSALLARPRRAHQILGHKDEQRMHDPLTAWFAIQHAEGDHLRVEDGWSVVRRVFMIEREGEWTKGMCVVDRRGTKETQGTNRSKSGIETVASADSSISANSSPAMTVNVVTSAPANSTFSKVLLERVFWHIKRKNAGSGDSDKCTQF